MEKIGAPLLGLAKYIYYLNVIFFEISSLTIVLTLQKCSLQFLYIPRIVLI